MNAGLTLGHALQGSAAVTDPDASPSLVAVVDVAADGSVRTQVAGEVTTRQTLDLRAARAAAQVDLVDAARRGGCRVRATVREPAGTVMLEVDPDGSIRDVSPGAGRVQRAPRRQVLGAARSTMAALPRAVASAPPAGAEQTAERADGVGPSPSENRAAVAGAQTADPRPNQEPPAAVSAEHSADAHEGQREPATAVVESDLVDDGQRDEFLEDLAWTRGPLGSVFEVRSCRQCGCTETDACGGGCWWVDVDLCSSCLPDVAAAAQTPLAAAAQLGPGQTTPALPAWSSVVAPTGPVAVVTRPMGDEPELVSDEGSGALKARAGGGAHVSQRVAVAAVGAAGLVALVVGLLHADGAAGPSRPPVTWGPEIAKQAAADASEREWIAERRSAARTAEAGSVLQGRVEHARAVLAQGREVLEGAANADLELRAQLESVLSDLTGHLDGGSAAASWLPQVARVHELQALVAASHAEWQQAEEARLAAEREAAARARASAPSGSSSGSASSGGSSRAAGGSTAGEGQGSGAAAQPVPAPQPGAGKSVSIRATPVATGSDRPGVARVNVVVEGNQSVTVTFTVAGQSAVIGTVQGSGSLTGEISGLPAGRHAWTVSGGGVSASGSIQVF